MKVLFDIALATFDKDHSVLQALGVLPFPPLIIVDDSETVSQDSMSQVFFKMHTVA